MIFIVSRLSKVLADICDAAKWKMHEYEDCEKFRTWMNDELSLKVNTISSLMRGSQVQGRLFVHI